jgi:hypothetical protein
LAAQRGRRFEPLAGVSVLVARIDLTGGAKADDGYIECRARSNAGLWCVGPRLQTDADRARIVEGLAGAGRAVTGLLKQPAPSKRSPTRGLAHAGYSETEVG